MSLPKHKRNKIASLYSWHRYAGVLTALFVIFISITGVLLNHTDELSLKSRYLDSNFLLDQYHVKRPLNIAHYSTQLHVISQADDMLFIDNTKPIFIDSTLTGAVENSSYLFISLVNSLLVVDQHGQLLETLGQSDSVPNHIERFGIDSEQHLILLANKQHYQLTENFNIHKTTKPIDINWSAAAPLSQTKEAHLAHQYRSRVISVESFLLDIHSGRFFGRYGQLAFDAIAIILIFLAITGLIMWFKQRAKKRGS